MKTSPFQFTDPVLTKMSFFVNEDFVAEKKDNIEVNVGIEVNTGEIKDNEAPVELKIVIGEKGEKSPFYIVAVEGASFKWLAKDFKTETEIDRLLNINAPALLLSYLRPIIAMITSASTYPTYNIPFINFSDYKKK